MIRSVVQIHLLMIPLLVKLKSESSILKQVHRLNVLESHSDM